MERSDRRKMACALTHPPPLQGTERSFLLQSHGNLSNQSCRGFQSFVLGRACYSGVHGNDKKIFLAGSPQHSGYGDNDKANLPEPFTRTSLSLFQNSLHLSELHDQCNKLVLIREIRVYKAFNDTRDCRVHRRSNPQLSADRAARNNGLNFECLTSREIFFELSIHGWTMQ